MARRNKKYWKHRVEEVTEPTGIYSYCSRFFPILGSKSAAKKAIAGGRLKLNGRKARPGDKVSNGDVLELLGSGLSKAKSFDIDLDILCEDDFLLVVNKPAGIAVNGKRRKTLENALAGSVQPSRRSDALPRPVAVHRIDVPTRGLVLLAKTKTALIRLSKAFQENQVEKEYVAVVHGQPPAEGRLEDAVAGKKALTIFSTLDTAPSRVFGHLSLLQLKPVTGRTHQLRVQLEKNNYLIVGDKTYANGRKTILGKGLFLCSCRLQFDHPGNGKRMDFQIDPPKKFRRILWRERQRFKKR